MRNSSAFPEGRRCATSPLANSIRTLSVLPGRWAKAAEEALQIGGRHRAQRLHNPQAVPAREVAQQGGAAVALRKPSGILRETARPFSRAAERRGSAKMRRESAGRSACDPPAPHPTPAGSRRSLPIRKPPCGPLRRAAAMPDTTWAIRSAFSAPKPVPAARGRWRHCN